MSDQRMPAMTLITEALSRLAAPSVVNGIIASSLADADVDAIPEAPQELARFVGGPLLEAVVDELGQDYGQCVLEDLAPIIRLATQVQGAPQVSGVHPRVISQGSSRIWVAIVDDDPDVRKSLQRVLVQRG